VKVFLSQAENVLTYSSIGRHTSKVRLGVHSGGMALGAGELAAAF